MKNILKPITPYLLCNPLWEISVKGKKARIVTDKEKYQFGFMIIFLILIKNGII